MYFIPFHNTVMKMLKENVECELLSEPTEKHG